MAASEKSSPAAVQTMVVIHGIDGGAWCWYKIKCLLENTCGYKVRCLDLSGCGNDQTDPASVASFHHYNKPLLDFLSSLPPDQQVILVGHSAGGLSLTHAIHKFGRKKIKLAVFVAATMLKSGFLTHHDVTIGVPEIYNPEKAKEIEETGMKMEHDDPSYSPIINAKFKDDDFLRKPGRQLCSLEDQTLMSMLERPSPLEPLMTAKFEEEAGEDPDMVPRVYIKTTYDDVLKPAQQEAMIKKWPPAVVYEVGSDHFPTFSAPVLLSGLLHNAARLYG